MKAKPKTPRLLALAAALTALVVTGGCDKFKSREQIRDGNEFFKVGRYDTALAKYNEALKLDPDEKKIYKNLGLAYMGLYQPGSRHPKDIEYAEKAIDYLKKYIEAFPEDKKAPEYLVTMYMNSGRLDDALGFFTAFIAGHPNDAKALETMANLYFQKADFANGVAYMEKAMKLTGPKKESYELIGAQAWDKAHNFPNLTDEQRQGVITQGIEAVQKSLAIDADYAEALSYINLLYREQAKLDEKTDKAKAADDIAKADDYRSKAIEIFKKRQAEKAAASAGASGAAAKAPGN